MTRMSNSGPGAPPPAIPGMSDAWREYALHLREVLELLLPGPVDRCLPFEEKACGGDYAHHCLSYMAAINARSAYGIDHLTHGDPLALAMATNLVNHWAETFQAEDAEEGPCDGEKGHTGGRPTEKDS